MRMAFLQARAGNPDKAAVPTQLVDAGRSAVEHAAINQHRATVGGEVNDVAAGTAEKSAELHRYAAFPSREQLWPQNVVVEPSVFYHE